MDCFNPLKAKATSRLAFDLLDRRERLYPLSSLDEYSYRVNGKGYVFTDYALRDGKGLVLRAFPTLDADTNVAGHELVLLEQAHQQAGDEGLLATLNHESGVFEWWGKDAQGVDELQASYWRVGDGDGQYEAQVTRHADKDGDGKVQPDEREIFTSYMWDYHRETKDEAGQDITEYLYVHQDPESGWVTMWKGHSIPNAAVTVV